MTKDQQPVAQRRPSASYPALHHIVRQPEISVGEWLPFFDLLVLVLGEYVDAHDLTCPVSACLIATNTL
jgi:hypothetical protein